jgi:ASPIC and UnbV/Secretion system C-terminal sorting domain/FG-GAP-like repeat
MNLKCYPNNLIGCKKMIMLIFIFVFQLSYSQDDCANALPISAGLYTVDAINGTQVPSQLCLSPNYGVATATEWYAYTPTENHSVTVTTDLLVNSCHDTRLHVYTGSCTSLLCIGGDDDGGIVACNGSSSTFLSTYTFDAIAGTTYFIVFDNKWQSTGFDFQIIENILLPNLCNLSTVANAGINTVDAITETTYPTACASASLAKWYKYIPSQDYHLTISSDLPQNICKDTNFNVYTGTCPNGLVCVSGDDNSGIIACNSGNTNSNLSKKTFDVTAGTTYYIVWDNKWNSQGFDFEIIEGVIVIPVTYNSQTLATINSSDYNLCVVDMKNDGKDDIVSISTNNLKIHTQGAAGAFTVTNMAVPGTSFMPSWSMAAGDYNRDGFKDLVLGSGQGLSIWKSNSTGTAYTNYTPGQYIFCQRTNFADLNNDGNLDVFSCHDIAPNAYYLNDSSNNLTYYQSTVTPGAMSIGAVGGNYSTLFTDFDNDGDADVLISKCSGPPCELHRNDGNGVYTDISAQAQINITPIQTWSSAVADFDNDGDMDIIITASSGAHHFFRNNLDTSNNVEEAYTEITSGSGWDTNTSTNIDNVAYDFDNDGLVDVLGGGNKIMFNLGNDVFSPTAYPGMSIGAVGDLNNDGFLDILNGSTIRYAIPNGNNWIKVGLEGNLSNANGIGARVEIYGAFGKKIRDIRSGEGFKYMSSMNAHFGIGQATSVSKIIIRWPSGKVDEMLNPTINQYLKIVENSTNLKSETFVVGSEFSIYPNPASDVLNITLKNNTFEIKSAQILDLTGRVISNSKIVNNTIDIKNLAIGTYVLVIKNKEGKQFSEKFLKN